MVQRALLLLRSSTVTCVHRGAGVLGQGMQRWGAALWSGGTRSVWASLKVSVQAALNTQVCAHAGSGLTSAPIHMLPVHVRTV